MQNQDSRSGCYLNHIGITYFTANFIYLFIYFFSFYSNKFAKLNAKLNFSNFTEIYCVTSLFKRDIIYT